MANEQMPRVDMQKEFAGLNESDKHFVKKLERMNQQRAVDVKALRSRNKVTGLLIGGFAVSVYFYTIFAMKQEKFLDDFEEPKQK